MKRINREQTFKEILEQNAYKMIFIIITKLLSVISVKSNIVLKTKVYHRTVDKGGGPPSPYFFPNNSFLSLSLIMVDNLRCVRKKFTNLEPFIANLRG